MKKLNKMLITATIVLSSSFQANNYTNTSNKNENIKESNFAEKKLFHYFNPSETIRRINKLTIPIIMFHKIGLPEDRYTISSTNFRKILKIIHENNYILIGLNEFKNGDFSNVPVGKKPLLLTFDDAGEGQFYFSSAGEPLINSAIGILENFKKDNYDFKSKAVFFISYSDDKQNFREPFIEQGLSEVKIKYLFENGYDIGWHTPFHSNNTNASKQNVDEQTIILDALIFKSLGEKNYNKIIRSFAHPFGAKPKDESVLKYLYSKYDLVFDAWGGNSPHPLSEKYDEKSIPRIETHINNIESILNNPNNYEVTFSDSIYYNRIFNRNIEIEPRGLEIIESEHNWDYFLNESKSLGEL